MTTTNKKACLINLPSKNIRKSQLVFTSNKGEIKKFQNLSFLKSRFVNNQMLKKVIRVTNGTTQKILLGHLIKASKAPKIKIGAVQGIKRKNDIY